MSEFDAATYSQSFRKVSGWVPFDYQIDVARSLFNGSNVVLRAPTGAGKTWSVLAPFLFPSWNNQPMRLIYVLPLRTLAQGIYREALDAAKRLGLAIESQQDSQGREMVSPFVTLQTGEQPDDRFFDRGRIIVTTYDQLLSGFLCSPYGLSDRLHNVNAAAVAGSLVVFDEFHLMEPHRAFLTAVAGLRLFQHLSQTVWMTATATQPLQQMLQDALRAVPIPANDAEMRELLASLPSVSQVTRRITLESTRMSADAILAHHERRSLVLLNTVGRAQAMFEALRHAIEARKLGVPLLLLHSRFFKEDRRAKEAQLRSLFGRGTQGPAILVATQVVEAGLDISCDHLHTEICPMNALVQRAGRCARFEGEEGTVHVYPLPEEEHAWLPYGDQQSENGTLTRTRALLERVGNGIMDPLQASEWVREVHGPDDEIALQEGWMPRLEECLRRIEQNAIVRDPKRVADLIRGDDTDSVRVIINDEAHRPESPGQREALSLSRRSLYRLFQTGHQNLGWFWDGSEESPWKPLQSGEDLQQTYVVCLRPLVAAYDEQIGLRLGIAGSRESPPRSEPKRPGHAPLRAESWSDHAQRVVAEARARLTREGYQNGLLGRGFQRRYGLNAQNMAEAVQACSRLHDLGKLQETWQRWAEAAQKARNPAYSHVVPLAHTDFDPEKPEDREQERNLGIKRPPHAAASAFYSGAFLARLLPSLADDDRTRVASACAAAVLAHHGGWLPDGLDLGIVPLCSNWEQAVENVLGWHPDRTMVQSLCVRPDKRGSLEALLRIAAGSDSLKDWWPLVAYLTRTLRLSDQRATAEGASHE
ncbi:MAG: CRISPR-associated helicase Cas3' [Nitrospirota bacterium]